MKVKFVDEELAVLKECDLEIIPEVNDSVYFETRHGFCKTVTVKERIWDLEDKKIQIKVI